MIVLEDQLTFTLFTQDSHARVSGEIARHWRTDLFPGAEVKNDVLLAITEHDRGWLHLDGSPQWNRQTGKPYDFLDFPVDRKISAYSRGIKETAAMSPYAGLLCSLHYTSFMEREDAAADFLAAEHERQRRLKESLGISGSLTKEHALKFHFYLLQLCDNLSLYLCLNRPGTAKADEHPFFKNGFPQDFPFFSKERIYPEWPVPGRVVLSPFPFTEPFIISLPYKEVHKESITRFGLIDAYEQGKEKMRSVELSPKAALY